MHPKIAYCGIDCTSCDAYQATQQDNDELRRKVAATWSEEFESEIKTEDINCNGCQSTEGPIFLYSGACEIRACAQGMGFENCAHCPEYSCYKTEELYRIAPEARQQLDSIRKQFANG